MSKLSLELKYRNAITYAFTKYRDVKRESSNLPYVIRPLRITSILRQFGYNELEHEDIIISTLLHGVIEETSTGLEEIERLFGKRVADLVSELTQPEELKKDDWLECFMLYSKEARIVKLADRIDNLLDMEECSFPEPRKSRYYEQSKIILRTCIDVDIILTSKLYNLVYYRIYPKTNDTRILFNRK